MRDGAISIRCDPPNPLPLHDKLADHHFDRDAKLGGLIGPL